MCSKGGGSPPVPSAASTTFNSTVTPNPPAGALYTDFLNRANALSNTPFNPGMLGSVAPLTAEQQTAGAQLYNQGLDMGNFDPAKVQAIESPYTEDVVQATQNWFNNQNAIQGNDLLSQAIRSGNAFGGDRAGVAEGILSGQQQLAQAPVIAGLRQAGYTQALDEYNKLKQFGIQGAGAALGWGGLKQAQTQRELDVAQQNAMMASAYPFQTMNWYGSVLGGVAPLLGTTASGSNNPPTAGGTGLGAASAAVGLGTAALGAFGGGAGPGQKDGGIVGRARGGIIGPYRFGGLVGHYDDGGDVFGSEPAGGPSDIAYRTDDDDRPSRRDETPPPSASSTRLPPTTSTSAGGSWGRNVGQLRTSARQLPQPILPQTGGGGSTQQPKSELEGWMGVATKAIPLIAKAAPYAAMLLADGGRVRRFDPIGDPGPGGEWGWALQHLPRGKEMFGMRSEATQAEKARRGIAANPPSNLLENILSPQSASVRDALRRGHIGSLEQTGEGYRDRGYADGGGIGYYDDGGDVEDIPEDYLAGAQMAGDFRPTFYAPGPGDRMEGGFETSMHRPGGGPKVPLTLDDYRLGRSDYITAATDPSRYGQGFNIGSIRYRSPEDNKTYALTDVPAIAHDTGSAFRGRPDKIDLATGDFRGWNPLRASGFVARNQAGNITQVSAKDIVARAPGADTTDTSTGGGSPAGLPSYQLGQPGGADDPEQRAVAGLAPTDRPQRGTVVSGGPDDTVDVGQGSSGARTGSTQPSLRSVPELAKTPPTFAQRLATNPFWQFGTALMARPGIKGREGQAIGSALQSMSAQQLTERNRVLDEKPQMITRPDGSVHVVNSEGKITEVFGPDATKTATEKRAQQKFEREQAMPETVKTQRPGAFGSTQTVETPVIYNPDTGKVETWAPPQAAPQAPSQQQQQPPAEPPAQPPATPPAQPAPNAPAVPSVQTPAIRQSEAQPQQQQAAGGPQPVSTKEGWDIPPVGTVTNPNASAANRNEQALQGLTPDEQRIVKGIADYKLDPNKVFAGRSANMRAPAMQAVTAYDPNYDQRLYPARAQAMKEYGVNGQSSLNIKGINTVLEHMGDAMTAADKLGNTTYPIYNKVTGTWAYQTGDVKYQAALKEFKTAADAAATEAAKTFRGVGSMSQRETQLWQEIIGAEYDSPVGLRAAMKELTGLVQGRLNAQTQGYNAAMGPDYARGPESWMSPKARETVNRAYSTIPERNQPFPPSRFESQPAERGGGGGGGGGGGTGWMQDPNTGNWKDPSGRIYDRNGKPLQ